MRRRWIRGIGKLSIMIYAPTRYAARSTENSALGASVRQFAPQDHAGVLAEIGAVVPVRLVGELVDVEVDVPVKAQVGAVRPEDARVPDVRFRLQGGGVVVVDGVLLGHEHVDRAVAVAGEAVRVAAALAEVLDVVGGALGGEAVEGGVGPEIFAFDAVEVFAG